MYLITGGAGFIGSNLIASLEKNVTTNNVICDCLGSEGKWKNISKRDPSDLIAPNEILAFIRDSANRLNAVFHMGAITSTSETDADLIVETNFRLSRDIWNICTEKKIPLIYASSAATYGLGEFGFKDGIDRETLGRFRPLNAYGWGKHLFDRWIARQLENRGLNGAPPQWAGLKFFNVYGPNEYHKRDMTSVVYKNFREISKGGPAILFRSHNADYPDGRQMRDFIWVGDCVKVMLWLLENPSVSGLFNVGTGRAQSFEELSIALFKALGWEPDIEYIEMPPLIRNQYQYFTEAEMASLRNRGYNIPFLSVQEGIQSYVCDYLIKDDPYK